jgi:hypothetical protein
LPTRGGIVENRNYTHWGYISQFRYWHQSIAVVGVKNDYPKSVIEPHTQE